MTAPRIRSRVVSFARVLLCLALFALLHGCRWPATQLLVVVDTDLSTGPGHALESIAIMVRSNGPDGAVRLDRRIDIGPGRAAIPLSFGVYPLSEDADRTVWIEVRGCGADGCAGSSVATVRAISNFVRRETRVLHLSLAADCAGLACPDPATTCDAEDHLCTSARVDPRGLPEADGGSVDGGSPHATQLASGGGATCALESDGTTRCWGGLPNTMVDLEFPAIARAEPTPMANFDALRSVAVGRSHACAVKDEGTVWCWGANARGQLGDGTRTDHDTPVPVSGLDAVREIAAGPFHTCALRVDGSVWCWGRQLDPERPAIEARFAEFLTPQRVPDLGDVIAIAAGGEHDCAVRRDGSVRCWGRNENGQLGDGTSRNHVTPVEVATSGPAISVVAGFAHACVVLADRTMQCWGDNAFGQLGSGMPGASSSPVVVRSLSRVVRAASGRYHVCARLSDGGVSCWGRNDRAQVGDGTTDDRNTPVTVPALADVGALSAGAEHTCARRHADHAVLCWGSDSAGQLGSTRVRERLAPTAVDAGAVGILSAGSTHTSALVDVGVVDWGLAIAGGGYSGDSPYLQDGPRVATASPTSAPGMPAPVRQITVGYNFACALLTDGTVRCWGGNDRGELGDGTRDDHVRPVQVLGISNATQIATGIRHTCALLASGTVRCWGGDLFDEVGFSPSTRCVGAEPCALVPGDVSGLTDVRAIAAGGSHTCAIVGSGALYCWGANEVGQLGVPIARSIVHPVPVPGVSNPEHIALGNTFTCFVADGVRCFGGNNIGQLGSIGAPMVCGTTQCSVTPLEVPGLRRARIAELAAGYDHACVRTAEGRVACWGSAASGQLGVPSTANAPGGPTVPQAAFTALTDAAQLALGFTHTCVRIANGTLRCFGDNTYGQLGESASAKTMPPAVVEPLDDAVDVAAGAYGTCARQRSGALRCWGDDFQGQIGDGLPGNAASAVTVLTVSNATGIALSGFGACALLRDTTARCWGVQYAEQLADGIAAHATPSPLLVQGAPLTGIAEIAAGFVHYCARMADGTVGCWGANFVGQLGDATGVTAIEPQPIPGLTDTVQVVAGGFHSCALRSDRTVACWGNNGRGELGQGGFAPRVGAVTVRGLTDVTELTAGAFHTCARRSDGSVWCWGADDRGQLGDDAPAPNRASPVRVVLAERATHVTAGEVHTCAQLESDGTFRCWGGGESGQIAYGGGTVSAPDEPAPVPLLVSPIDRVACGSNFTCARRPDRTVVCWGNGLQYQLGQGAPRNSPSPVMVGGVSDVDVLVSGNSFSCAIVGDGTVRCWGWNLLGALGDGSASSRREPTLVRGLDTVLDVSAGFGLTCARLSNGTARCRGADGFGQLGDFGLDTRANADDVVSLADATQLDAGVAHACAVTANGAVQCWGLNAFGQLGLSPSSVFDRGFPLDVPGVSNASAVAVGGRHTCALHVDGTVSCWGANDAGQLGRDASSMCSLDASHSIPCDPTPVLVPNLHDAVELRAGGAHTCARHRDGSLTCWGANTSGQLGLGRVSPTEPPTPVPSLDGVDGVALGRRVRCDLDASVAPQCVATGDDHTCVRRTGGTTMCWGRNDHGQLGDGTTIDRSSPVAVVTTDAFDGVSVGGSHTCARLANGSVRCWGDDAEGQLGLESQVVVAHPAVVNGL